MAQRTHAPAEFPPGLHREALLEIYRYLYLTRSLEERLVTLFRQSKVVGGLFRSLGQEGESVASAFALRRRDDGSGDVLSPLIRNLGSMLVMGARPIEVLRQYMARGNSPTKGKELNIHFTDFDRGFIGQISPLGDLIPVMAGVTLTFRQRREDRVGMVYVGDGATSTGAFHEGVNLAAVQRCPLVVVVENNQYAYSTPLAKQTAAARFVDKAVGYGIAGERVDGNDVLEVYAAASRAVDRARSGDGATLLEVVTYRRVGHAQHDNQEYQPSSEIEQWAATNDPIDRFTALLTDRSWASDVQLAEVREGVEDELDVAVSEAEASPMPAPLVALEGVTGDALVRIPWTRSSPPEPARA